MTFQEQIGEHAVGAGRLYTLKTRIEDVVSWRGIVVANPQFERGDDLVMHLMVNQPLCCNGTMAISQNKSCP